MATFTETVDIDVDLDDFDDDEIIEYLQDKGYYVSSSENDEDFIYEAIHRWNRQEYGEALFLIERAFPQLFGLSKFIKP